MDDDSCNASLPYILLKKKINGEDLWYIQQEGQEALNRSPEYTGQKSNI